LSEPSTGSDAEHGLFATETYRAPRCRSPADDERLNPHPPRWCSFSLWLYVVADDLLVQRTGLQRRKRRCSSTARHLILGVGLPVVGLYASTSCLVYRARGFRDGATCVQPGCCAAMAIALKDLEICNQYIFFCAFAGPGVGPGVGPGAGPTRFLARAFGIQLAVALSLSPRGQGPSCLLL
jgi:hypothetical protein